MKKHFHLLWLLLVLACTIAISCSKNSGSSSYNTNTGGNNNNNPPASSNTVSIANMSFSPASITVKAGTTVTWTNNDNTAHTVTADDNSFNSGNMAKGSTYSYTFNTAGTFKYHCQYHSTMTASVIVN